MSRKPLLFLGAGQMALNYAITYRDDPNYEVVGYVQDRESDAPDRAADGLPILAVEEALGLAETHGAISAIGSRERRGLIERFESAGFHFPTLVHPSALVGPNAVLEPGCFVGKLANVDPYCHVGKHALVTARTNLAHHTTVGPYARFATAANVGGGCRIGAGCEIGLGAILRDHVTLGDDVTVGAGAVVIADVPSGATVVGNPARPLKA